jgi:hypothetical protein
MSEGNGHAQQVPEAGTPLVRIVIDWMPTQGRIEIGWPQVDDVIKLGLLEMAKQVLGEQRARQGMAAGNNIVVPQVRLH